MYTATDSKMWVMRIVQNGGSALFIVITENVKGLYQVLPDDLKCLEYFLYFYSKHDISSTAESAKKSPWKWPKTRTKWRRVELAVRALSQIAMDFVRFQLDIPKFERKCFNLIPNTKSQVLQKMSQYPRKHDYQRPHFITRLFGGVRPYKTALRHRNRT